MSINYQIQESQELHVCVCVCLCACMYVARQRCRRGSEKGKLISHCTLLNLEDFCECSIHSVKFLVQGEVINLHLI